MILNMKTGLKIFALLLVFAGGYLTAAHLSGGAFPTFGLPLGGELGQLRATALAFMEDVQFKDFDHAATYHDPDSQDTVDIPYLLQRLFVMKPEALEIVDYEVVMADLDSSGDRARVKLRVKANDLVREKVFTKEFILYFRRDSKDAPWYMELEDSLRNLDVVEGKKH